MINLRLSFKLLLGIFLSFAGLVSAETVVRAAIDFGSGAIKMQVAEVDLDLQALIGEPWLERYTPFSLMEASAANAGTIPEEMEDRALAILREYRFAAIEAARGRNIRQVAFAGAATAVFRTAKRADHLLLRIERELGIPIQIISQEEEGRIGWKTAHILYPDVEEGDLIAWDSGSGSFQITQSNGVYEAPVGHGTVRLLLAQSVRHSEVLSSEASGNPLALEEIEALEEAIREMLLPVPGELIMKLKKDGVVAAFGSSASIFGRIAAAIGNPFRAIICREDVDGVINRYTGKEDEWFDRDCLARKTLTSAVLLRTVMDHVGIVKLRYQQTVGNTPGMLIALEEWNPVDL